MALDESKHKGFLQRLDRSWDAVFVVIRWFCSRGYTVVLPQSTKAEHRKDWSEHSDDGDMYVRKDGPRSEFQRIEVKRLSRDFSGRKSFPFNNFIVDSVHLYNRKKPRPDAYFVLSKNMECLCILQISDESKDNWVVDDRLDRNTNEMKQFYVAQLSDVKFYNLRGDQ